MNLSIIIPTHNPDLHRLSKTLLALKEQTLPVNIWELIIIDNNSDHEFDNNIDLSWHPAAKVVKEEKRGLTFARLKGFDEARGAIIVMVDDDNLLDKDYLEQVLAIFDKNAEVGAIGGKSVPLFESPPPAWLTVFYANLALRDLGDEIIINKWNFVYPSSAPVGAGMAIRKIALSQYIKKLAVPGNIITDRVGKSLGSGGDNDIVLELLKAGWSAAYFPSLRLVHIIPKQRMQVEYLARLANNTNTSWVFLLENHGINPWSKVAGWTVPLRKLKAWLAYKAWIKPVNYIKWRGACGIFDGQSKINHFKQTRK